MWLVMQSEGCACPSSPKVNVAYYVTEAAQLSQAFTVPFADCVGEVWVRLGLGIRNNFWNWAIMI